MADCIQHPMVIDTLMKLQGDAGAQKAHVETLLNNQAEIFTLIRDMHTKQISHIEKVDQIIDDLVELRNASATNRGKIADLTATIQNGLTSKVNMLVEKFATCPQSRGEKINSATAWFKDNIYKLAISGAFFLFIWALSKAVIFQENSIFSALVKWFGVPK